MFSTDTLLSLTLWLALINLKIQTFLAKPVNLETRSTVLNLPLELAFPAVVFLAMKYFLKLAGQPEIMEQRICNSLF
jgi:hypothetical protein